MMKLIHSDIGYTGCSDWQNVRLLWDGILPDELTAGISRIEALFPDRIVAPIHRAATSCVAVSFQKSQNKGDAIGGFVLQEPAPGKVTVEYHRRIDAFRALGVLMGNIASGKPVGLITQKAHFTSLGVMIDVSRNGVLRVENVKHLIGNLALMGINQLMLYTEDTYEIPGEPFFGYFRGRYTQEQLRSIDDCAADFGIEAMPCIQTLGHLEQMLHWPAYSSLQDTTDILLAGDPAVEAFIQKMITAASAPFRSRRIHIGMDEAHGIGSGQYRHRNQLRAPFEILSSHLDKVAGICRRLELEPMIWSDMYFRLGSSTNSYYDRDSVIPPEVAKRIPANVRLVYWDYFRTDLDFCNTWIARHRELCGGKSPVFAGGVWTWDRFWTKLPRTFATLKTCMQASRQSGLREAFVTLWGDDGMECDLLSALPGIQFFAECGYAENVEEAAASLKANLYGSCGVDADAWASACAVDSPPGLEDAEQSEANPSKWLLWHDPLLNFLDKHVDERWPEFYANLSQKLKELSTTTAGGSRLLFIAELSAAISCKAELHLHLRHNYAAADFSALRHTLEKELPKLKEAVRRLWLLHRTLWHELYQPFGWETVERRYGGLLLRLETLEQKLTDYLAAPLDKPIAELEHPSELVYGPDGLHRRLAHRMSAAATVIQ